MKIGVVAVQGSVVEHLSALTRTGRNDIEVVEVRRPEHLEGVDGLILPGGESTAIARLLNGSGLFNEIQRLGKEGMPIMGTCAGCVLLSTHLCDDDNKKKTPLLGLMDMTVSRNAFGRQVESFEANIEIDNIGSFHGVFIRAPSVVETKGDCKPMAAIDKNIVMARQNNLLALSFHPELTPDARIHEYFLKIVEERK